MDLTTFSSWRSSIIETFEDLRIKAILASFSARVFGKNAQLKDFTSIVSQPTSMRVYIGERDISVSQITGSVGRDEDFDSKFRPLKKHLRDRWVNVYAMFQNDQVPPIQVFKVGNDYYVEDGHHRVSVAHTIGQLTIRAQVWEFPAKAKKPERIICQSKPGKGCESLAPAWKTKGEVL